MMVGIKTLLKTMTVVRDTLAYSSYESDMPICIELNLVTENVRAAVDLRQIPHIPCKY